MAMFEPTALDHFGDVQKSDARRRCANAPLFALHRRVTLAHTLYETFRTVLPPVAEAFSQVTATWGLDVKRCANDPSAAGCDDVATPWGLALTLAKERDFFRANHGWNVDGSYDREFNRIPYSDWRENPYAPRNPPFGKLKLKRNWRQLVESDGRGFIWNQVHVTPHIGFTGRSIFFTDEEICEQSIPAPKYNLHHEMNLLIERMANLDDTKKMEIELFDSKLTSIVPLQVRCCCCGLLLRAGPGDRASWRAHLPGLPE